MKKAMIVGMMMGLMVSMFAVCGCFTSAKAYTKRTATDGTLIESYVSVVGTGDKASQVAAEGMFADGAEDDLGAGVRNASANQTSSGIDGTLKGMGDFMGGMASMLEAYGARSVGVPLPPSSVKLPDDVNYTPVINASRPIATEATPKRSLIKGEGLPEIVILGNRPGCPWCNRLWAGIDIVALSDSACGANIIDADINNNRFAFDDRRPSGTNWEYPWIRIYVGGKVVSEFSGRGLTQSDIATKAKKVIGECDPGTGK